MNAAVLLREFQAVGLRTYSLDDRIWSIEPMVEFLAWSFRLDVLTRQPDHVTYGELASFCMPIGVLPLRSSDLLPALLNSCPELNKSVSPRLGIRHVRDSSISWKGSEGSLDAWVELFLSIKWPDACRGMYAIVVGKLS
jgi:hypothetical protein